MNSEQKLTLAPSRGRLILLSLLSMLMIGDKGSGAPAVSPPAILVTRLDHTSYARGEDLTMWLTIHNAGPSALIVPDLNQNLCVLFGRGMLYPFAVDQTGTVVTWQGPLGNFAENNDRYYTKLAPGESVTGSCAIVRSIPPPPGQTVPSREARMRFERLADGAVAVFCGGVLLRKADEPEVILPYVSEAHFLLLQDPGVDIAGSPNALSQSELAKRLRFEVFYRDGTVITETVPLFRGAEVFLAFSDVRKLLSAEVQGGRDRLTVARNGCVLEIDLKNSTFRKGGAPEVQHLPLARSPRGDWLLPVRQIAQALGIGSENDKVVTRVVQLAKN